MKSSKRQGAQNPIFERRGKIDERNEQGDKQVDEHEAPALAYLYEHAQDIALDIKATDQKRNDKKNNPAPGPYILLKFWKANRNRRQVSERIPGITQKKKSEQKIIRSKNAQYGHQPFTQVKRS